MSRRIDPNVPRDCVDRATPFMAATLKLPGDGAATDPGEAARARMTDQLIAAGRAPSDAQRIATASAQRHARKAGAP